MEKDIVEIGEFRKKQFERGKKEEDFVSFLNFCKIYIT